MISSPIGQYRSQLTGCWSLIGLISVLLSHITQMITAALLTDKRGLPQPLKYKHSATQTSDLQSYWWTSYRRHHGSPDEYSSLWDWFQDEKFSVDIEKVLVEGTVGRSVCPIVWTFFKIFKNRYPRSKTARDILDLEETNKNCCLQEYRSVVKQSEISVPGMTLIKDFNCISRSNCTDYFLGFETLNCTVFLELENREQGVICD